jgi:hypothetical protein
LAQKSQYQAFMDACNKNAHSVANRQTMLRPRPLAGVRASFQFMARVGSPFVNAAGYLLA